jgi:putative transposase
VKYAWIRSHSDRYAVSRLCRVVGVSRSGYVGWRVRKPSVRQLANERLGAKLRVLHAESRCSYGRIRLHRAVRQAGYRVGQERIRRLMVREGLRSVHRPRYRVTTDSAHRRPVALNVLDRQFLPRAIDRVWAADITYVPTDEGWLYLAVILDLGSRRVVGWSLGRHLGAELACNALTMAYWRRKPPAGLVIHSDRGVQYASAAYRTFIERYGMVQSMSRRANCWDNAPVESFFKTFKVECVRQARYITRDQARQDIVNWIEGFYNARRMHSAIGYVSPVQFERSLQAA